MLMTGDPKPFRVDIDDPVERLKVYLKSYHDDKNYKGFEAVLMRNIRVLSAVKTSSAKSGHEARAVFEVTIVEELCNPMGNAHGGAVATIADMATTMAGAPVASPGWWEFGGVSRTLAVTYISPLLRDATVLVDCTVRSVGSRMSVIQCIMTDKKSGKLLALAEHGKVALSPQNVKNKL